MTRIARIFTLAFLALTALPAFSAATQTITFDPIADQILGISPFPVTARTSSGLPVTFIALEPAAATCMNAGSLIILIRPGQCAIAAVQYGNSEYGSAAAVVRTFNVTEAKTSGSFGAGTAYPTGSNPSAEAVGDFNEDGVPDLAVADYYSGKITVLPGTAGGGLTTASGGSFGAGLNPIQLVVGDFNGDGHADVAVLGYGTNNLAALLGDGTGAFAQATGSPFPLSGGVSSIAVGDFNGDGIEDLAVTNFDAGQVSILIGNGNGGFAAASGSPYMTGSQPGSVVVGDVNGDGIQDLAIANQGSHSVTVLKGTAGGDAGPDGSVYYAWSVQ